jgi:hypothetical protein
MDRRKLCRVILKMIYLKVKENVLHLMVIQFKDNLREVEFKEEAHINLVMEICINIFYISYEGDLKNNTIDG